MGWYERAKQRDAARSPRKRAVMYGVFGLVLIALGVLILVFLDDGASTGLGVPAPIVGVACVIGGVCTLVRLRLGRL